MLCGHGPGAAIRAPGQTSRHVGATAVDLVPLDPEALKDVRLVLGAGEEFERDDHDPRHDRADREDDSERDAVRGEEHREAEDDEGERQDRGVQARLQLRREVVGEKQADDEDTDGHRQRRRGDDGVDVHARDVLERLRHDVQTTTDGRERRPDEDVAVPEAGRTPTVTVQHRAEVGDEVRPPEPERDRGGR